MKMKSALTWGERALQIHEPKRALKANIYRICDLVSARVFWVMLVFPSLMLQTKQELIMKS